MAEAQGWDRVLDSPAYQALPRDAQLAAKAQYFHEVLAPKLGNDPQALGRAYSQFMDYRPIRLGQGETIERTGEAGLRQGAAGVLRTLGSLIEYAGEHPSGEMGLPAEAYQPVYGTGDPLFKAADRQTDQARKALPQPGEKAPFWGQLIGGTTGILAAPFAAQQAATDQLRQGAGTGRAIAAAAAETPASAIQLAAPELGGRLGGRLINQPGLRHLGAKALGGGVADVVAEPLSTEVRNQGLPEEQRQHPQVTGAAIGGGALLGAFAHRRPSARAPALQAPLLGLVPPESQRPGGAGIEVHEGEPERVELRGLAAEPTDRPATGTGLQEPVPQGRHPDPTKQEARPESGAARAALADEQGEEPAQVPRRAKPVQPTLKSGHSVPRAGREIIQWGAGPEDAEALARSMTPEQSKNILRQLPAEDIAAIGKWYRDVAAHMQETNPEALRGTPTPLRRAELMDRILKQGAEDDRTAR